MVPKSHQVNSLHYLAQLQMDHFKNITVDRSYSFLSAFLLFLARIYCQEIHGCLKKEKIWKIARNYHHRKQKYLHILPWKKQTRISSFKNEITYHRPNIIIISCFVIITASNEI